MQFYANTASLTVKLAELGPDLLATALLYSGHRPVSGTIDPVSPEIWLQKLRNPRIPNKQVGDFLMEQKYISGIGNYLRAEILYHAKIRPDRALSSLTHLETETLYRYALKTIVESYSYGGLTIENYWSPDGRRGTFPKQVYGKTEDPYGNPVVTNSTKGDRTVHWVPAVQI